jgi:hypothetical protein
MGCFCCVQFGLANCNEPLQVSLLPQEYRSGQVETEEFGDIVEAFGLFPLYAWDIERPVIPNLSVYENMWMVGRQKRVEKWRNAVYQWSKVHHRTLMCHRHLCGLKIMLTEYDMSAKHLFERVHG